MTALTPKGVSGALMIQYRRVVCPVLPGFSSCFSILLFWFLWIMGGCHRKAEVAFPRLVLPAGSTFRLIQPVVPPSPESHPESRREAYNGTLFALARPAPGTLVAAGAQSTVWLISEESGQARKVLVPVTGEFYGIFFSSPSTGFIVGNNGLILKTGDRGAHWKAISSPIRNAFLQSVWFPSPRIGYIAGERGTLLKSEDGGDSWKLLSPPTDDNLYSVYFIDEKNGWIAGWGKTFLRTRDGGQTFRPVPLSVPRVGRKDPSFNSLWGQGDRVYLAGDHGLLYRSTDGGQRFTRIDLPVDRDLYGVCEEGTGMAIVSGERGTLYGVGPGDTNKSLLNGFPWADFLALSCGSQNVRVAGVPNVILVPRPAATASRP